MKFKVGDKVTIVGNTMEKPFSHNLTIGDTATIDRIDANDDAQTYYVLSSDGVYQWVAEKDIEKAEEKAMKFKVGDKVRIKSKAEIAKAYGDVNAMPGGWNDDMDKYCGKIGEIIRHPNGDEKYSVSFGDKVWEYGAEAFTLASSFTVTITFTGDTTTATDGEHTATVTKYHDDEYSEETGAIEAIKKLYHRFPQKGDEYYVVYIDREGAHADSNSFNDDYIDKAYRDTGNFYETEAAAQAIADKINAIFKEEH